MAKKPIMFALKVGDAFQSTILSLARSDGISLLYGINKDSPEPREVQANGEIDKVAVVNGLHHYYFRRAA